MPTPPKPCAHCGTATFTYLPNLMVDIAHATTLFGKVAAKQIKGVYWTFSMVVCTQCGCTQTFTLGAAELAKHIPGAGVTTGQ